MNRTFPTSESPLAPPAEVPLVSFSLRHMFCFVAGFSVFCMILVSLRGYSAIVFGTGILLAAGHVASTMIGSRLRARADAVREWELRQFGEIRPPVRPGVWQTEIARPSQLQIRTTCGRLMWCFVGAAILCGALLGAGALNLLAGPGINAPGQLIGSLSVGLVFGWAAFIVAGICGIARRSWRDVEERADRR